jgi:hypothetical protein
MARSGGRIANEQRRHVTPLFAASCLHSKIEIYERAIILRGAFNDALLAARYIMFVGALKYLVTTNPDCLCFSQSE